MNDDIENSFEETIKDSNLQNLAINSSEIAIDSIIKDGLLEDIPIISTITSVIKLGVNIQDRLFLKKIISFLGPLEEISAEKRKEIIKNIDKSQKYKVRVGEKLLYIIDKSDDYEMAGLISEVFKYFLEGNISYNEFLKTSSVLNNLTISDFKWFIDQGNKKYWQLDDTGDLINSGLFELHYEQVEIRIEKETDRKVLMDDPQKEYNAETENGGLDVLLSRSGEIILEIFSENYEKPETLKI